MDEIQLCHDWEHLGIFHFNQILKIIAIIGLAKYDITPKFMQCTEKSWRLAATEENEPGLW